MADVDVFLDFGPWWYAPGLATMIGGLTIYSQDVSSAANIATAVVAGVISVVLAAHDYRRRSIRVGVGRPSGRSAILVGVILLVCWILLAAWGTAISSLGYERFIPGYAALAWVLTTGFLLGVRALLSVLRRRRRRVMA